MVVFLSPVTKRCAEARLDVKGKCINIFGMQRKTTTKKTRCPFYMVSTVSFVWLLACGLTVRSKVRIQPRNHYTTLSCSASLSACLQYFLSGLHCAASESVIFLRFPITVWGSVLGRCPPQPFTVRRQNSTILIKVESALKALYSQVGFALCLECRRIPKHLFFIIRPAAPVATFP